MSWLSSQTLRSFFVSQRFMFVLMTVSVLEESCAASEVR